MTVHTSTWHYRRFAGWARRTHRNPSLPISLCLYFWVVLLFGPTLAALDAMRLKEAAQWAQGNKWMRRLGGVLVGLWILACLSGLAFACYKNPWFPLIFGGVVVGAVVVVVGVLALTTFVAERKGEKIAKTGRLALEFAKAKKRHVCPLIQVWA